MSIQLHPEIIDGLIAPEFSKLTIVDIPEVIELPNYWNSYLKNNMFSLSYQAQNQALTPILIRHLTIANREYRNGRQVLINFPDALTHSSDSITLYLRALACFEQVILRTALAANSSHAIAKFFDEALPYDHVDKGDKNSPEYKLRSLYNTLKHFDERVTKGEMLNSPTPIWIVRNGLRSAYMKSNESYVTDITFEFSELAGILKELASNVKFISEESYQIVYQRRQNVGRATT